MSDLDWRRKLLAASLVALLALLAYGQVLFEGHGFVWDDYALIVKNEFVRSPGNLLETLGRSFWSRSTAAEAVSYYRPLTSLSYVVDFAVWGERAAGYHAVNILLHAGATVLTLLLVLEALSLGQRGDRRASRAGRPGAGGLPNRADAAWSLAPLLTPASAAAIGAASLFAVHPVHVESVTWISGRTDLLLTVFALVSLLVLFEPGSWRRLVLGYVLFLAALAAKETAAVLPFVVLCLTRLWPRGHERQAAVLVVGMIATVVARVVWMPVSSFAGYRPAELLEVANLCLAALAGYARLCVWPRHLSLFYCPPATPIPIPMVLAGAILFLAGLAALLVTWRKRSAASLLVAIALVTILPALPFYPLPYLVADHNLYLPSVGLCGLAGWGLARLFGSRAVVRRGATVLLVALIALLTALTVTRNREWVSEERLYRAVVRDHPCAWNGWTMLGNVLIRAGKVAEARHALDEAVRLRPFDATIWANLAAAADKSGDTALAESYAARALAIDPRFAWARWNHGLYLYKLGRIDDGLAEMARGAEDGYREAQSLGWLVATMHERGREAERAGDQAAAARWRAWAERLATWLRRPG